MSNPDANDHLTPREAAAQGKAAVLREALPWITRFHGQTVVIKYGGNAMVDEDLKRSFAADVALLHFVGLRPIVVHGGGPQISQLAGSLGIDSRFVGGLRVTDEPMMDVVRMALLGKVNPEVVGLVQSAGAPAVGVAGTDSGQVMAIQHDPRMGLVGRVDRVDPTLLHQMLDSGRIPVMATLCTTADGQTVNVNADEVAGAVAQALGADKLIYLTNVAGLYENFGTPASTLLSEVGVGRLRQMIADDELVTGMIPKIASIVAALDGGVPQAHLLDGRIEHAILLEIFTDAGVGTMILPSPDAPR